MEKQLQAESDENDIFIVACNGTGHDGNTEYAGHSMVINPNGDILDELNREKILFQLISTFKKYHVKEMLFQSLEI